MEAYPVADIREGLLDDFLVRLAAMMDDYKACLKLFSTWKRKYKTIPAPVLRKMM